MDDISVYEHEIPSGTRLYFGQSAKLKRKIERAASEILEKKRISRDRDAVFLVSSAPKRAAHGSGAL